MLRYSALAVVITLFACQSVVGPEGPDGQDPEGGLSGVSASVTPAHIVVQNAPNGRVVDLTLYLSINNSSNSTAFYRRSCSVSLERNDGTRWVKVWQPGPCTLTDTQLEPVTRGEPFHVVWPVQAVLGASGSESWQEPISGEYRLALQIYLGESAAAHSMYSEPFQVAVP